MTEPSKSAADKPSAADSASSDARFETIKVYLKDVSFEAPSSPMIFLEKSDKPKSEVDIRVEHNALDDKAGVLEVILKITITAKQGEHTLYLAEVEQGGIFQVQHPDSSTREIMVEVTCPHILLPFAREELNSLITKGGFNSFLLAPINFDGLFKNKKAQQKSAQNSEINPSSLN